jgi:hypothetical protein
MPVERVAAAAAAGDLDATNITSALGLPCSGELPVVPARRANSSAEHVTIGLDIENPAQDPRVADRLSWVIVNALRAAGISPDQCERQDGCNGRQILTLPAGLNIAGTVVALLRAVRLVASQANSSSSAGESAPILATLAKGRIRLTGNRYEGSGISAASSILESGILRTEIHGRKDADFAAMLSNDLYLHLYSQGYGLFDFNQFQPVDAIVPGVRSTPPCWLYTPAREDASMTIAFSDARTANAQSRLLGAIPLAGMGALMWWHHSEHSNTHPEHGTGSAKDHQDSHGRHDHNGHGQHHAGGPGHPGHHDHTHAPADHPSDHGYGDSADYTDHHGY